MRVQFAWPFKKKYLAEVTLDSEIFRCLIPQKSSCELLAQESLGELPLLRTLSRHVKMLEWLYSAKAGLPEISAFSLTAGKHVLIYMATVKVTAPWERRKNGRFLPPPNLLKLIFIKVCVWWNMYQRLTKGFFFFSSYLWVWEIIFNNC